MDNILAPLQNAFEGQIVCSSPPFAIYNPEILQFT